MKLIYISNHAKADLDEIWLFIAGESVTHADNFIDLIRSKIEIIAENPSIEVKSDELAKGLRKFSINRYNIFYFSHKDRIEVVRVLSAFRNLNRVFE